MNAERVQNAQSQSQQDMNPHETVKTVCTPVAKQETSSVPHDHGHPGRESVECSDHEPRSETNPKVPTQTTSEVHGFNQMIRGFENMTFGPLPFQTGSKQREMEEKEPSVEPPNSVESINSI